MIHSVDDIKMLLKDSQEKVKWNKYRIRRFDVGVFVVYSAAAGLVWAGGQMRDWEVLKQAFVFGVLLGCVSTLVIRKITANDFPHPKDEVRLPDLAVELLSDVPSRHGPNPFLDTRNRKGYVTLRQAEAFIPRLAI